MERGKKKNTHFNPFTLLLLLQSFYNKLESGGFIHLNFTSDIKN